MKDTEPEKIVRFLKGESGREEKEQVEAWLLNSENKQEFEKIKKIWEASGDTYKNYKPDMAKAWENIELGISGKQDMPSRNIVLWKWIGKIAATLIIAVSIGWIVMQFGSGSNTSHTTALQEISTGPNIDSLVLSDGSVIWLNRNTTIQFPETFDAKERKVILMGEAFFEVKRDTERPFIVEARGTVTRVLGTSFNIDARESKASVAVFTGKVSFSEDKNPENSAILTKGEKARIDPVDHRISKSVVDPNTLAWKTGVLIFQNTPLSEVTEVLSDHYHKSVALEIPDSLSLTTSFEKQSLEEVLEVICMTLDLKHEQTSGGYILKK